MGDKMIEYGLSKHQLERLSYFSYIFNRDNNQMILDFILVVLCLWKEDRKRFNNGVLDPDIAELGFFIELPGEIEDELYDLSEDCHLSIEDTISAIVGLILIYLDKNWSGEFGLESKNMTNQEKFEELRNTNNEDDDCCWKEFFR